MIRFFQWLFYGHVHKWKIIKEGKTYWKSTKNSDEAIWMRYTLQCETCGEMKTYDSK